MKLLFSFGDGWFWRGTLTALLLGVLALNLWGISPRPASAAAFDVDMPNDDPATSACTAAPNDCSLRGAITTAGLLGGADTINLPAGTYTLVGSELTLDSDTTPRDDVV